MVADHSLFFSYKSQQGANRQDSRGVAISSFKNGYHVVKNMDISLFIKRGYISVQNVDIDLLV